MLFFIAIRSPAPLGMSRVVPPPLSYGTDIQHGQVEKSIQVVPLPRGPWLQSRTDEKEKIPKDCYFCAWPCSVSGLEVGERLILLWVITQCSEELLVQGRTTATMLHPESQGYVCPALYLSPCWGKVSHESHGSWRWGVGGNHYREMGGSKALEHVPLSYLTSPTKHKCKD